MNLEPEHEHGTRNLERGTNTREFRLPRLERVISGPGSLDRLPSELDRYGCARALIVTGRTVAASALAARVRSLLGSRYVGVFDGVRQHVPSRTVASLLDVVRERRADGLVSVGGGSPIDTAKAAVHALLPSVPLHIAVPTTLSAGEFTDVAGVTDESTRIKRAIVEPNLAPRTVIADPDATFETPDWLWSASGIRALDHAVETLYAPRVHPISEPLATRGIELLLTHLPGRTVADRAACQMAAWMAVFGITNAGFGLSHVLGHQIGPRWNVAHGLTSAIVLPHVMRLMAREVPDRFASIARGFGVTGAEACADAAAAFIARLDLPARLRDVDVSRDEVGAVADHVLELLPGAEIIGRPIAREDLLEVLRAAY